MLNWNKGVSVEMNTKASAVFQLYAAMKLYNFFEFL